MCQPTSAQRISQGAEATAKKSLKQADGYDRLHLGPAFGRIKAAALTTETIRSFTDHKKEKYQPTTINRWLEALRHAYVLGQKKDPPMVYTAPNIKMLMLDESGNVREASWRVISDALDKKRLGMALSGLILGR